MLLGVDFNFLLHKAIFLCVGVTYEDDVGKFPENGGVDVAPSLVSLAQCEEPVEGAVVVEFS